MPVLEGDLLLHVIRPGVHQQGRSPAISDGSAIRAARSALLADPFDDLTEPKVAAASTSVPKAVASADAVTQALIAEA